MKIHDSDEDEPSSVTPASGDAEPNPEVVRRAIRARGREIKRRELQRAFDRFQAHETLTDRRRRIIERMATAIVDGVLHAPDATLADADEYDRETVRTAVGFFDPDR